ncbi:hypothetical protein OG21DRAFT_539532 [Imleria badia]|nr:hypothetical protein OG21DRAFT_539532 [Imleria badia]
MELKKTGWIERADKWSVVELGLQGVPLPITPPKTPSKDASLHVGSSRSPKHRSRSARLGREHSHDTMIKSSTPTSIESPVHSQDTDLVEFSTLSYTDGSKLVHRNMTPTWASVSRKVLHSQSPRQPTGGRLGQVVRNLVKRMLPPTSGGGASSRDTTHAWARHAGAGGDSASGRTWRAEMTPRSDVSGESRWTFASASSWMEGSGQGCLDYQTTNRWSGFWHC